jgi:hypothetical protein
VKKPLDIALTAGGTLGAFLLLRAWAKDRDARDRKALADILTKISREQAERDAARAQRTADMTRPKIFVPTPEGRTVPAPPSGPRQIMGNQLSPTPGSFYRVTVDVKFPASVMATSAKVQREAEKNGFTNVNVSTSRPQGWPGENGSYYVSATYSGEPKPMDRSYAGGQVVIKDVWEG